MHLPLREGDFYYNDNGLIVFTEQYHLRRGYCCGSACKHCPYDHLAVPENKKESKKARPNGNSPSDTQDN